MTSWSYSSKALHQSKYHLSVSPGPRIRKVALSQSCRVPERVHLVCSPRLNSESSEIHPIIRRKRKLGRREGRETTAHLRTYCTGEESRRFRWWNIVRWIIAH